MVQLVFQQHLVLGYHLHKGGDAFVNRQYVLRLRGGTCAWQCSQDVLQFFTLGVEDMTQGKLFHSDGCDNHVQSFIPCHVRPASGKGRHRHIQNSIVRPGGAGTKMRGRAPLPLLYPMTVKAILFQTEPVGTQLHRVFRVRYRGLPPAAAPMRALRAS